jgi:hypothetical protein
MLTWAGRKNMRRFPKFRNPRFALTTLQIPTARSLTAAEERLEALKEDQQGPGIPCQSPHEKS